MGMEDLGDQGHGPDLGQGEDDQGHDQGEGEVGLDHAAALGQGATAVVIAGARVEAAAEVGLGISPNLLRDHLVTEIMMMNVMMIDL